MSIREIKENLGSEKQQEIIDEYIKNHLTIRQISKKYNLRRKYIGNILRFNDVYIEGSFITKKNKEIFESDIGQKIIQEYQLPGNNVRSLSRKYNLKRLTINVILKHANVILKSDKDVKKEYKDLGLCTGKNHPRFGKRPPIGAGRCRWYYYNGKTYQGTWEFKVGLWLEYKKEKFYCHENVRQFKYQVDEVERTYCPDFYLPDKNIFIEVKGYFTKQDKEKINIVKELYQDVTIEIYDKSKLKELQILDIDERLDIILDKFEICYKDNSSLNGFIAKYEIKKIDIIKGFLFEKLSLTKLANKYDTTYRVMSEIYKLWIKELVDDDKLCEEFTIENCTTEINELYSDNYDLRKLLRKYRISRHVLDTVIVNDLKEKRLNKQKKKYDIKMKEYHTLFNDPNSNVRKNFNKKMNKHLKLYNDPNSNVRKKYIENYNKHLLKFNLPEITQEIKEKVLIDYQNEKSVREICKTYNLRKKKVKKILLESDVEIRHEKFYTEKRWRIRNEIMLQGIEDKIVEDYKNNVAIRELNRRYNVKRGIIKKVLVKNNIEIRPSSYYSAVNASKKDRVCQ